VLPEAGARPPEFFAAEIASQSLSLEVPFEESAAARLATYLAELDRWRRRTNLTGPLSPEDLVQHVLESAAGSDLIPHGARVVDIGSGAGLPGLPLAIVRSDLRLTLLEPRRKRAAFLEHAIRSVPIENASVRRARAEDLEPAEFDVATSRAVGGLPEIVGKGGFLIEKGLLLVWTTTSEVPARALSDGFSLDSVRRIPHTREKAIARYRRT
jgi:16S rRNA (guanine(527)-N(7))-methyltransferase RsmG